MSDPDPASPPARPAGHRISDRAALEAAMAGAAGLLLGRVLLGRGAGLLAGTAAIAARLVSGALKSPAATASPDDKTPVDTPPEETPSGTDASVTPESDAPKDPWAESAPPGATDHGFPGIPATPTPLAAPIVAIPPLNDLTWAGLTASQEEPVEVVDIGQMPEPAAWSEIPFPFTEDTASGSEALEQAEPAGGSVEVLFVELPPVEPTFSVPKAVPETEDVPLPAFPAWEAFAARLPGEPPVAEDFIPPDAPDSAPQDRPDEPSQATSPLPAFPGLADLADPEAIWKMAAAESAPVPEPEAPPGPAEPSPAPADNPFAALFASYGGPAGWPAVAETTPIPEALPNVPASLEIPQDEPAAISPPEDRVTESTGFLTAAQPPDSIPSAPGLTAIEAKPERGPGPAASKAVPLPPAPDPASLPLLSLKVPVQVTGGNTAPVPAPTGPNLTAPIEIVETAAMEALETPPPRQAGPPQTVPAQAPRRSSWKAWFLVALLAGGGALFYWKETQKAGALPPAPPAGGSSSASPSPALPPPAGTTPPATIPPAPAGAAPAQPVPGVVVPRQDTTPPATAPKTVVPADPPLVAEPTPGVPQDFPPGSPEAIARQTLEKLLAAKTVKELGPLVHQPAEALRVANTYFPDGDLKPSAYQRILLDALEPIRGTAFKSRLFRVVTPSSPLGFPVAVEDTKEGPRVDFDAFVQCRDRLLDAFMVNRSTLPGRYLVVLRRGHYFGEDLKPEVLDRLLCLEISSPIPDSPKYQVFIPRSTELGKLAQRKFAWNQVYTPVVELSHSGTYVSLNAILQDTWQRSKR